jgi:glycerophosphoryl diester phosphodiesterase
MKTIKVILPFLFLIIVALFSSCAEKKNGVVAHRGAWKANNLPENSIASLRHAIDMKASGSEFDVQMTVDDSLVINHDPHYNNLKIEETKYADLIQFKLSNGEKLPTLHEYIKPSVISVERGKTVALKAVETVKKLKAEKITCYISFDYEILKQIRKVDSKTTLQYLEGNKSPSEVKIDHISGVDYHYSVFQKHPEWIKEAKDNHIILNAWTVNEAADMDWIIAHNFDYITTNEPELLNQKIKEKK